MELAGVAGALFEAVGHHVHGLPPLAFERVTAPCSSMNCGDIVYRRDCESQNSASLKGVHITHNLMHCQRAWP
eukprot:scaffold245224_cov48-Prasinocladus_malaysianus.AAC.1